jgi:hypothetical protein
MNNNPPAPKEPKPTCPEPEKNEVNGVVFGVLVWALALILAVTLPLIIW